MKIKKGYSRIVILLDKYAFKFARGTHGRRCNVTELYFSIALSTEKMLAPVVLSLFNCRLIVQKRCAPFDELKEGEAFPTIWKELNSKMSKFGVAMDPVHSNIGWLNGNLVYFDYGN